MGNALAAIPFPAPVKSMCGGYGDTCALFVDVSLVSMFLWAMAAEPCEKLHVDVFVGILCDLGTSGSKRGTTLSLRCH